MYMVILKTETKHLLLYYYLLKELSSICYVSMILTLEAIKKTNKNSH